MRENTLYVSFRRATHGARSWERENRYVKFTLRDGIPVRREPAQITPRQSCSDDVDPYDLQQILSRRGNNLKYDCEASLSSLDNDSLCPTYHINNDLPEPWGEPLDCRQYLGALPDECDSLDPLSGQNIETDCSLGATRPWDRNFDTDESAQAREDRWRDNDVKRFAEVAQYLDHTALQTLAAPEPTSPFSNYPGPTPPSHTPVTTGNKVAFSEPVQLSAGQDASFSSVWSPPPSFHLPSSTATAHQLIPTESSQPAAREYQPQSTTNYLSQLSLLQPPSTGEYHRTVSEPLQPSVGQQRPQSAVSYSGGPTEYQCTVSDPAQTSTRQHQPQCAVGYLRRPTAEYQHSVTESLPLPGGQNRPQSAAGHLGRPTENQRTLSEPLQLSVGQNRPQSASGYLGRPTENQRSVSEPLQLSVGQNRPQSAAGYLGRPTENERSVTESLQLLGGQRRPQSAAAYLGRPSEYQRTVTESIQLPTSQHLVKPTENQRTVSGPLQPSRQHLPQFAASHLGKPTCFRQISASEYRHSPVAPTPPPAIPSRPHSIDHALQTATVQRTDRQKYTYPSTPQLTTKQHRPTSASNLSGLLIPVRPASSIGSDYTRAPPTSRHHNYSGSVRSSKPTTWHRDSDCAVADYLGKTTPLRILAPSTGFEPQPPSSAPETTTSTEPLSEEFKHQLTQQQQLQKEASRRKFAAFADHLEHTYPLNGPLRIQSQAPEEDYLQFADITPFLEEPTLDDLPTSDMYHRPIAFEHTMPRRPVGAPPPQVAFQQYQQRPEGKTTTYRFANPSDQLNNATDNMVVSQIGTSEKKELQDLNNRLSAVLQSQQPQEERFNATSLLNAVDCLEQELAHVRTTYEHELGKIR